MKNKSKLVQRTIEARKNVRNLAVTLLPGAQCEMIDMRTLSTPKITKEKAIQLVQDITDFKHNWSVLLVVCGRCPINGSYWKTLDVAPPMKLYSSQINESLSAHHEKMIADFNPNHFVSLGWIARPVDVMFDNDMMYDLFMRLGAWDYIAKWEKVES